ncbi:MAG: MotA/TolQ/ExbB proton channel family protein [bacterium]|nr:MotA/TolQ/ExbB proton channel family protein [bacterium]
MNDQNQNNISARLRNRPLVLGISAGCGLLFILVLSLVLKGRLAVVFLDINLPTYPFTIQNLMHLVFFIGLGELLLRWKTAQAEMGFLVHEFLPEDEETVLQTHDLGSIRRSVKGKFDGENGFLPHLIDLCILQFQASRSVDQAVSVMNSSLELIAHRVDLRYQVLRYIAWAIPTFGFIGTVMGIAGALEGLSASAELTDALGSLATAFNTTLIALILSAILVFLIHMAQKYEERSVNLAGDYCLRNLINRLYSGE